MGRRRAGSTAAPRLHDHLQPQGQAEHADDGRARRQVQGVAGRRAPDDPEGAHGQDPQELGAPVGEQPQRHHRRHHQQGEHQQHAGHLHARRDDHAQHQVEDEVPPRQVQAGGAGALRVGRDALQLAVAEGQHDPQHPVQHRRLDDHRPAHPQDRAHEQMTDLLGPVGHARQDEDHGRAGHHVDDADVGLLGDGAPPRARPRQQQGAQEGRRQAHGVGRVRAHLGAQQHGHGHAQGRDLRQGDVHEDHAAPHHVRTQVAVHAHQHQGDGHGGGHQFDEAAHGAASAAAAARAAVMASNRAG